MSTHVHLDPVGGIAGDMFVAAMLDLRPSLADAAIAAVRDAGLDDTTAIAHRTFTDGILSGSRFDVSPTQTISDHQHVHWSSLKQRLSECRLSAPVRARAIDIFSHLAEAEARVHGKSVDSVAFHEVGAWDSIADIVAAAYLIESAAVHTWSIGAIPVGNGRVSSQHGLLPVPAPATVLLLAGFNCFDDGFPGERVTPTGAAIVKHLQPSYGLGPLPRRLMNTGYGFGSRRFEGMSNVLRATQFETVAMSATRPDQVSVVRFEVDDQSAEDLALGLERIRSIDGVIDVTQSAVTGKQGRLLSAVQVLAKPELIEAITETCFHETTTLGLRLQLTERLVLDRRAVTSRDGTQVKVAARPTGPTAKAEIRDVKNDDGHHRRQAHRYAAESEVLADNEQKN